MRRCISLCILRSFFINKYKLDGSNLYHNVYLNLVQNQFLAASDCLNRNLVKKGEYNFDNNEVFYQKYRL